MKTAICGDSKDVTPCYQNVIGLSDYPTQTWDPAWRHGPPGAVRGEGRPRTSPWGRESPVPLTCSPTGQGDRLSPAARPTGLAAQAEPARVPRGSLPDPQPRHICLPGDHVSRGMSLGGLASSCLPRRSPHAVLSESSQRSKETAVRSPPPRGATRGARGWVEGARAEPALLSCTWWPP